MRATKRGESNELRLSGLKAISPPQTSVFVEPETKGVLKKVLILRLYKGTLGQNTTEHKCEVKTPPIASR